MGQTTKQKPLCIECLNTSLAGGRYRKGLCEASPSWSTCQENQNNRDCCECFNLTISSIVLWLDSPCQHSLRGVQVCIGMTTHPPAKHSLSLTPRLRLSFLVMTCQRQQAFQKPNMYLQAEQLGWLWIFIPATTSDLPSPQPCYYRRCSWEPPSHSPKKENWASGKCGVRNITWFSQQQANQF